MRHKPSSVLAAALGLVLAGRPEAIAQGVSLSRAGSGARAAGMGDAFVAVSDDGTAASWNPAGLAQLRQPELSFVYGISERGLSVSGYRSPDGRLAYAMRNPMQFTGSNVDFASAALPFSLARRPTTIQFSWRRLYQLSNVFGGDIDRYLVAEPTVPVGSTFLEDRLTGAIDVLTVAAAVKLTSRAALGAGFDFWRGDWRARTSVFDEASLSAPTPFVDSQSTARLRGHNVNVGLLLTYPAWNVGLVYHAPFWSSYRVFSHLHSTAAPPMTFGLPAGRFRLPRSIAAGVAWRPAPRWTASAAVTHDQWTDAVVNHIPGAPGPVNFFDEMPRALSSTRDTVSLNVGAEHLFVHEGTIVPLRLGLGWEPQGAMDTVTRDPVDYFLVSWGSGYNNNRFKLDAAVQYRRASFRSRINIGLAETTEGFLARDAVGLGVSHEWRIKVSAIYRVQDTEKLQRILRKIFG
jgi:long-subunit fatty acid transport protein